MNKFFFILLIFSYTALADQNNSTPIPFRFLIHQEKSYAEILSKIGLCPVMKGDGTMFKLMEHYKHINKELPLVLPGQVVELPFEAIPYSPEIFITQDGWIQFIVDNPTLKCWKHELKLKKGIPITWITRKMQTEPDTQVIPDAEVEPISTKTFHLLGVGTKSFKQQAQGNGDQNATLVSKLGASIYGQLGQEVDHDIYLGGDLALDIFSPVAPEGKSTQSLISLVSLSGLIKLDHSKNTASWMKLGVKQLLVNETPSTTELRFRTPFTPFLSLGHQFTYGKIDQWKLSLSPEVFYLGAFNSGPIKGQSSFAWKLGLWASKDRWRWKVELENQVLQTNGITFHNQFLLFSIDIIEVLE